MELQNIKIIRAATFAERAGACYVRIQAMAVKHHISLEREFDEHDTPETKYIIALDDVLPVATCRLYPLDERSMMAGRIVVLPEYRHHGLGSRMVLEAERWAAELGYQKVVLESRINKVKFYEKLGYVTSSDRVVHGDTFDCIHMEKAVLNRLRKEN
ncbi:MAG: GNAT family N-acetyltransferase [Acidaminococcaceae bacterium]|nr:GNAT family N-acetyltransferase [Acidaminococcaceae bacterium]